MAVVDRGRERREAEIVGGARRRELALVAVAALAVYASTRSAVPALTHDALAYLVGIELGGDHLYHPHHLAYGPATALWLDALGVLGLGGSLDADLPVAALLNGVAGAAAAALVHALLRNRARLPRHIAAAGTLGAGLSFGVWFYSGSVEVYVLPLALLLAALYVLTAPQLTGWHIVAVGLLHGLAVLGHQVHLLFAAVVVAALAGRGLATRAHLVRYLGALAGVVVTAYALVLALVVHPRSPGSAADWFTAYAQDGGSWYRPGPATVPAVAFGLGRSVVGGHFVFRLDAVADRVAEAFPGKSLSDEAFLVRGLGTPVVVGLAALAAVAAGLLATVLVRGLRDRRRLPPPARRLVVPLVVWLGVYGAFFVLWEPWNVEFWIPQATALWLLLAVLCAPRDPGQREAPAHTGTTLLVAAVLVAVVNLFGSILPASDQANDVYARRYGDLDEVVGAGDAVVVDRPHLGVGYARRFAAATPIPASEFATMVDPDRPSHDFSVAQVLEDVDRVVDAGRRVAVPPELLDRPASGDAARTGEALRQRYGTRWRSVDTTSGTRWLVIAPA